MARRVTPIKPPAQEDYVPRSMVISLKQTTKRRYDEIKRSDGKITTRPFGFLYEKGDERRVFVTDDNVYYESINTLAPFHTTEMFSTWKTDGVEVYTIITLLPQQEDKSAA